MEQELEIQVLSDRREGLLMDLGKLVIAHGYTLLRQRMGQGSQGVQLTLIVRGPAERQLALEEAIATHPRVISIEAGHHEGGVITGPPSAGSSRATNAPGDTVARVSASPDMKQVEAVLPMIAREYPKIFPRLLSMERELGPDVRDASLKQVGRRTGAWVFKRDFSLGGQLPLAEAIKRIALPAMKALVSAELDGDRVRVKDSPLSQRGNGHGPSCHFFCGYLEGLLGEAGSSGHPVVHESYCRSTGADACVFEISR